MVNRPATKLRRQVGQTRAFNRDDRITEGWYWALRSKALRRGKIKPITLLGRDLAIYRGEDGTVRAADAYCPHMGNNLAIGKVEGNGVRCFFHGWRFDETGRCDHIPALGDGKPAGPCIRHWIVAERYGLIWIWVSDGQPEHDVPEPPTLKGQDIAALIAGRFTKSCHPNVVLVNAIDEHHFQTVHHMPGHLLSFETENVSLHHLRVRNTGSVPRTTWYWRLIGLFYPEKTLFYELNYYFGSCGIASFGPGWLRLNLMFANRPAENGTTQGVTIALTRRRRGILGAIVNWLVLVMSAIGGQYFAYGDTKVFNKIRFNLRNPIRHDRTVMTYIRHVEEQPLAEDWRETPADRDFEQLQEPAE